MDKIPQNPEAEKAVLGSMIVNEKSRIEALAVLNEDDFCCGNNNNQTHRNIFHAIYALNSSGKIIDLSSIADELNNHMHVMEDELDYVIELTDAFVGEKHALQHINMVRDLGLLRRLLNELRAITRDYNDKPISSVTDFVGEAERRILDITKARRVSGFRAAGKNAEIITNKHLATKQEEKSANAVTGLDTGFSNLNKLTLGLQPGTLCILAARPSVGKTTFAINIAYNVAANTGKTVAFFSLEMAAEEIVKKMLSQKAKVLGSKLSTGNLTENDWIALSEAKNSIKKIKILIDDTSAAKINDIRTKAQKLMREDDNLGLIVIDYMGLITTSMRTDNRQAEVAEISRSLKALARELNIPVLCLCQLSRASEIRPDHRPILSDLRDSGNIEQDADQVMFIFRPNYQKYDAMNQEGSENGDNTNSQEKDVDENGQEIREEYKKQEESQVILAKNRNGQVGVVYYKFFPSISLFMPIEKPSHNFNPPVKEKKGK